MAIAKSAFELGRTAAPRIFLKMRGMKRRASASPWKEVEFMSANLRTELKTRFFGPKMIPTERSALSRILLVDDDDIIRDVIAGYIEHNLGVRPIQAKSAGEALSYLRRNPMQILITDTNMPEMNGVDLLLKAKELDPELKVVVLFSGLNGSKLEAGQILRLGAFDVLSKAEVSGRLLAILGDFDLPRSLQRAVRRA
jgi:CheY-like chemotaxis protein